METDKLKVGDTLNRLVFRVTPHYNKQICDAVHCKSIVYDEYIHPSLLIGISNITKSPSFQLGENKAAIHTQDEVEFFEMGQVGDTLYVDWKIVAIYHKRDKKWQDLEYQVVEAEVHNQKSLLLKRRMTDYFLEGRRLE